MNVATEIF